MPDFEKRIRALEDANGNRDVRPAVVLVIGPSGATPEQIAAADLAIRDGVQVITVEYKDARRSNSMLLLENEPSRPIL